MWRVIAYPLAALAGVETIIVAAARGAYVWLGIGGPPEASVYGGCMIVAGLAALVVTPFIGYEANERAIELAKEERSTKKAQEERRIQFEREKLERLEALTGGVAPERVGK